MAIITITRMVMIIHMVSNNNLNFDIDHKHHSSDEEEQKHKGNPKDAKADEKEKSKPSNILLGVTQYALGVIFASSASFIVKFVYMNNDALNSLDYMLVRSVIMTVTSIFQAYASKVDLLDIKKEARFWVGFRCLLGVIAMPTFYYGLKLLPTSKVRVGNSR